MIFASDNWAGASGRVMAALAAEAARAAPPYGNDPLSRSLDDLFSDLFERRVAVFPVATGTASNGLALAACQRPGGIVFCHREAHVAVDECNAPEFLAGGAKLVGLDGTLGKIAPAALAASLEHFSDSRPHRGQPMALSLSQTTELGAVYAPDEIGALTALARGRGVPVHMDGARFANAVASLDASPADLTWRAGVDILSFGASKNGCIAAEAVVFFDPDAARDFPYLRKRSGHLLSKSRFIAAQLAACLAEGHWLELAGHANAMAARLAAGLERAGSARLAVPAQANEVFALMAPATAARLREAGAAFYDWPAPSLPPGSRPEADEIAVRMVTSFRTAVEEVDMFLDLLEGTGRPLADMS